MQILTYIRTDFKYFKLWLCDNLQLHDNSNSMTHYNKDVWLIKPNEHNLTCTDVNKIVHYNKP